QGDNRGQRAECPHAQLLVRGSSAFRAGATSRWPQSVRNATRPATPPMSGFTTTCYSPLTSEQAEALFVDDAFDLHIGVLAVRRSIVSLVVAVLLSFPFGLLVAIVRGPDAPVLVFGLARGNRHHDHVVVLVSHRRASASIVGTVPVLRCQRSADAF